jgi:hypothetical protein
MSHEKKRTLKQAWEWKRERREKGGGNDKTLVLKVLPEIWNQNQMESDLTSPFYFIRTHKRDHS